MRIFVNYAAVRRACVLALFVFAGLGAAPPMAVEAVAAAPSASAVSGKAEVKGGTFAAKNAARSAGKAPASLSVPAGPAARPAGGAGSAEASQVKGFHPAMAVFVGPFPGGALSVADTWQPLMRRMARDGVDDGYLRGLFSRMGSSYSHIPMGTKVNELFHNKFMPPPAKSAPQKNAVPPVYKGVVTAENIVRCREYLLAHAVAFAAMETAYGVPKEVVAGLLLVETRLGTFLGTNSSFWSLACMAAADKPDRVEPTVRSLPLPLTPDRAVWLEKILHERSNWAYKELLALVRHSEANGRDPLAMPGSVYGAIGICQFMPSNLPKYAVDGDKDGIIDLFDPADAIPSVGNFLRQHGWAGKDRATHHKALMRYNKSTVYANTILALADGLDPPAAGAAVAGAKAGPSKRAAGKAAVKTAPRKDGTSQSKAAFKTGPSSSAVKPGAPG